MLVGFPSGNPPKIGNFTAWNRTSLRARTPPEAKTSRRCQNLGARFRITAFPCLRNHTAKTFARYRVIWALRAQSWNKGPKTSSRGSGAQKVKKQSRKTVKIVEKQSILTLFRLWELIFGLFSQLCARTAQMTPVAGKRFPKNRGVLGDAKLEKAAGK